MRPLHSVRISEVICTSSSLYFVYCTTQQCVTRLALTYLWGFSQYTVFRRALKLMTSIFRYVIPRCVLFTFKQGFFWVKKQLSYFVIFISADDMFRPLHWTIFRSQDIYLRRLYIVNHKIGYMYLKLNEISSFNFPILCFHSKEPPFNWWLQITIRFVWVRNFVIWRRSTGEDVLA